MATIKLNTTKMLNSDANFISLVERGANRIPFKIIKQESSMSKHFNALDLSSIFTQKSEAAKVEPKVIGVAAMKDEDLPSLVEQLNEAGFNTANMLELEDGSVVFKQDESDDLEGDDVAVIRLNDHLALITKGFSPYCCDMGTGEGKMSFIETVQAKGFYPGFRTVVEAMQDGVDSLLRNSVDPSTAATEVAKLFDEAKMYALTMVKALPSKAFKAEGMSPKKPKQKDPDMEEDTTDSGDTKDTTDDSSADSGAGSEDTMGTTKKPKSKKVCAEGGTEESEESEVETETIEDKVSKMVSDQLMAALSTVTKKLDDGIASINTSVTSSLTTIQGTLATLEGRVAKAEEVATKAQTAVQGTIVLGSENDDTITRTVKEEARGGFGGRDIDTAFMGTVRKRASGK